MSHRCCGRPLQILRTMLFKALLAGTYLLASTVLFKVVDTSNLLIVTCGLENTNGRLHQPTSQLNQRSIALFSRVEIMLNIIAHRK